MKNAKRFIAIAMVLAVLFTFAACTGKKDEVDKPSGTTKVGIIHIGDPDAGSGFSFAHQQGIDQMQKAIGAEKVTVIRKDNIDDNDQAAIEKAINELIEDGCKVIFGTSWNYMEKLKNAATENPDKIFLHCSGSESNGTNFFNYFGRIWEARYLAGIVAGMNTKTNKIGYVAAQNNKNAEVTGGINAFALGVKSVNPDAEVLVQVTNTWFSLEKEKAAAVSLLDKGCDVITQHQDTAQPMIAAQEAKALAIGYNSDLAKEAPHAVMTNVVWNWGVYYTEVMQKIIAGEKIDNYFAGSKEGLLGLTDINKSLVSDTTVKKVNDAKDAIISGELVIFSGELKDNTGAIKVEKGKKLEDLFVARQIDWYVDNVKVS